MSENKKYYYMKLKEYFFTSERMVVLETMPDGILYSNLLLKMYLKLKTAIEESQKLDPTRTGQYTVQTWVTLWYEVFIKPQIRPNTKQFYRNCMENHLFPALGDCPLEKLSTIQIQRAINEMSEHGRNHYYSHIPLKETTLSPRIVQSSAVCLHRSIWN